MKFLESASGEKEKLKTTNNNNNTAIISRDQKRDKPVSRKFRVILEKRVLQRRHLGLQGILQKMLSIDHDMKNVKQNV